MLMRLSLTSCSTENIIILLPSLHRSLAPQHYAIDTILADTSLRIRLRESTILVVENVRDHAQRVVFVFICGEVHLIKWNKL